MKTRPDLAKTENHIYKLISQAALFNGLTETYCRQLSKMSHIRHLSKRDILFHENSKGCAFYLLSIGCIQLSKSSEDGRKITIRTIKPGEAFAEVILFETDTYPVTAVALNDSEVISMQRRDIMALLTHAPFRNAFIGMLMQRQRYLAERVRYLTFYDVEERLVRFLRDQYGEQERIHLTISKKDVAAGAGTTPESLSRQISRLSKEKLLKWQGKTLLVAPELWRLHP